MFLQEVWVFWRSAKLHGKVAEYTQTNTFLIRVKFNGILSCLQYFTFILKHQTKFNFLFRSIEKISSMEYIENLGIMMNFNII